MGKGEQVHGNSEIVAYACKPDLHTTLWLEEKKKFSGGTAGSGYEGLEWRQIVAFITPT